jgi:2,4-dienoyl-CoA reductase-like NADH-dependent reductase (Old Yellow Enzyme family)/thioredoxin reductase
MEYPHLFSEGVIGKVPIRNRTVMAPMVTGYANYDGTPSEAQMGIYEERARNGLGLLITGATRVDNFTGTLLPRQLSMAHDRNIAPFAVLVNRMHAQGTRVFCQIHHAGSQGMTLVDLNAAYVELMGRLWPGLYRLLLMPSVKNEKIEAMAQWMMMHARWPALPSPSGVPSRHYGQRARAMTRWELARLIRRFVDAAGRVKRAGGDGVELHAAHGYLVQQFLSPYTNRRRDLYGGSLENRLRFAMEIIEGIRREHGRDFAVIVRLSVDEFYEKIGEPGQGIELDEGVEMARRLERAGIDAIDVSSGNYETINWWLEPMSFEPGWRKHLARAVKEAVDIPVIAANLIRSPQQAEEQLADGTQDFAALGRPLLADPAWISKAAEGREDEITRCISCLWCMESASKNGLRNKGFECTVNPRLGREKETAKPRCDGNGRVVAVVGAGPAGLTAARVLADRGFKPVVFESAAVTGGQLNLGDKPPGKDKIDWCKEDLESAAVRSGVEMRFNTEPSARDLEALSPCAVIVATGAQPVVPGIPGADRDNVCTVERVLDGSVRPQGKRVAVIGSGMTGLETAELLAGLGNDLIVVEMMKEIAPGAFAQNRDDVLYRLEPRRPEFITSHRLVEIGEGSITLEHVKTKARVCREVDQVVLSVGVKSDDHLAGGFKGRFPRVVTVGDAREVGRIYDAVTGGFDAAWRLL